MAAEIRVGVIGTGIGTEHIRAFQQVSGAVVTAVCSAQWERAEATAVRYHVSYATADYRDLLSADVDAVVIATPPALHPQLTLDAIAAGKHVLCEKPLAGSLADAVAMRDAADAAGVVHMLNHQQRFGATYAAMYERVAAGYLGKPTMADARMNINPTDYLHEAGWSTSKSRWFVDVAQGGGILAGSACPHLIDLLLWCWGPVEAVCGGAAVTVPRITLADGSELENITAPDLALAVLRFANGGWATVRGVPIAYHRGGFSIELNGTAGALVATNSELTGATANDPAPQALPVPEAPWDRAAIAARFIHAIRTGGRTVTPNFTDGVSVQAVLDALNEAIAIHQWIRVPTV